MNGFQIIVHPWTNTGAGGEEKTYHVYFSFYVLIGNNFIVLAVEPEWLHGTNRWDFGVGKSWNGVG